jgi:hypothetical protein
MNIHVDPVQDILRARRRPPRNSASERDRLDRAAGKLFADLIAAGATSGTFYIAIGAGELHLYSPRAVMLLAQERSLSCDFVVDWHELKRDIADVPTRQSKRPRSEPASALSPVSDAGSTLQEVSA